ncbi:MAG: aminoacyl-tRNA hydrolase [Oscillospiraceae bacterium]|jgi:PTH1 family peptidyl-tRNA hydrolase|nr:aminoacyl-tRNA hydrolase [Oscillospiraceae bacterium]
MPEWIIAFLGNPGNKYADSRHNTAWLACDKVEDAWELRRIQRLKFKSLTDSVKLEGKRVLLMKPQTFMNNSGEAIHEAAAFYKLPPERILIVFDDMAIPPGTLRIKRGGSHGGHNGIRNIIDHLHTDTFPRVKIGVGSPTDNTEIIDWVLAAPNKTDRALIAEAIDKVPGALKSILTDGLDAAMNKFNAAGG